MRCGTFMLASLLVLMTGMPHAEAQSQVPADCPVTRPPDPPFVPPAPHPEWEDTRFWLGTNALWTSLNQDGIWRGIASEHGVRDKFWWWREGWTPSLERNSPDPGLKVTARRLDGEAPSVKVGRVTSGLLGSGWAMLLILELPTEGCWEVTGNFQAEVVSMVVYVPPFEPKPEKRRGTR